MLKFQWIHATPDHRHRHAQASKKPATKQSTVKPARDTSQTAKSGIGRMERGA